jgi:hypothetical protein
MFRTQSEKFLAMMVFITLLGAGGYTVFSKFESDFSFMSADLDSKKQEIITTLDYRKGGVAISKKYDEMQTELTIEGSDSDQWLAIRQHILDVFKKVGLSMENNIQRISQPEISREDDFKVITYSINQIVCTPSQLGELLYELEMSSNVIEINSCNIDNLFSDTGQISRAHDRGSQGNLFRTGLVSVDLDISRLVKYAPGEAPKKKRG